MSDDDIIDALQPLRDRGLKRGPHFEGLRRRLRDEAHGKATRRPWLSRLTLFGGATLFVSGLAVGAGSAGVFRSWLVGYEVDGERQEFRLESQDGSDEPPLGLLRNMEDGRLYRVEREGGRLVMTPVHDAELDAEPAPND
jgi:hypothetical protein